MLREKLQGKQDREEKKENKQQDSGKEGVMMRQHFTNLMHHVLLTLTCHTMGSKV